MVCGVVTLAVLLLSSCGGPPGSLRPGERWVMDHEDGHRVLQDGVMVARWRLDADISPPAFETHLRVDGRDVAVTSVSDVRPYLRPSHD